MREDHLRPGQRAARHTEPRGRAYRPGTELPSAQPGTDHWLERLAQHALHLHHLDTARTT